MRQFSADGLVIAIKPTPEFIRLDGTTFRVWNGAVNGGPVVKLLVHRVIVEIEDGADYQLLEKFLEEQQPPENMEVISNDAPHDLIDVHPFTADAFIVAEEPAESRQ